MNKPAFLTVREMIRKYRAGPLNNTFHADLALQRLEAAEDRVAAALSRLKTIEQSPFVFMYLIEAVDLAYHHDYRLVFWTEEAKAFSIAAGHARDLLRSCSELYFPEEFRELKSALPKLLLFLEQEAEEYRTKRERFGISRKRDDGARQLFALRCFVCRLRNDLHINLSKAGRPEAIRWLMEAVLGCEIPPHRVSEALSAKRRTRKSANMKGRHQTEAAAGRPETLRARSFRDLSSANPVRISKAPVSR